MSANGTPSARPLWHRALPFVAIVAAAAIGYVAGARGSAEPSVASSPPPATPAAPPIALPMPEPLPGRGAVAPPIPLPRVPQPTPLPRVAPEIVARVEREAAMEIDRIKPILAARCWETSPPQERPQGVTYAINVSFDPQGREIARGVEEERGSPPALGHCLRQVLDAEMRVSPPDAPVATVVAVTFP
jgi:hypothetical protein